METIKALILCVTLGICAAAVIKSTDSCYDDNKLMCKLRKSECKTNHHMKEICPVTCGVCTESIPSTPKTLYNFTYFDLKARGEQIRWIFVQGDANWIDTRVKLEDWVTLKPLTLTGQLPYMEVDGVTFAQSGAIAMYVGKELGLAGDNALETAEAQMIWDTVQESFNALFPALRQAGNDTVRKQVIQEFMDNKGKGLPRLIKFLETVLGTNDYLVGNKLTLADIVSASFLYSLPKGQAADAVKASKALSELTQRVVTLPKIAEWIKNHSGDL